MAEQESNENVEETAGAPLEGASGAEARGSAGSATEAEAEETRPAPAADATSADAEDVPKARAPEAPREPQEVIAPKERRRRARADKAAKVTPRGPRTAEERHAERVAERRTKAEQRRVGRVKARAKASHTSAEATPPREHAPGVQKVRQGVVVSDKADKTITVRIDTARRHRRYQKIVRTSRTLHAHDERNDAGIGDTVIVREARPLSRTKRWRLVEVVERAK